MTQKALHNVSSVFTHRRGTQRYVGKHEETECLKIISEKFLCSSCKNLSATPANKQIFRKRTQRSRHSSVTVFARDKKRLEIGAFRYDDMGNLILEIGPADTGRSILFMTYAMTHPASEMLDPFSAELMRYVGWSSRPGTASPSRKQR